MQRVQSKHAEHAGVGVGLGPRLPGIPSLSCARQNLPARIAAGRPGAEPAGGARWPRRDGTPAADASVGAATAMPLLERLPDGLVTTGRARTAARMTWLRAVPETLTMLVPGSSVTDVGSVYALCGPPAEAGRENQFE